MEKIVGCVVGLVVLAVVGCGDDGVDEREGAVTSGGSEVSGLPQDVRLDALAGAQREALCDWAGRLLKLDAEVDCGGGITATSSLDVEQCRKDLLALTDCPVTVKQAEACFVSQNDEPCVLITEACDALTDCE